MGDEVASKLGLRSVRIRIAATLLVLLLVAIVPRFYLYSIFEDLRFAKSFLILYSMDLSLSYRGIGLLFSMQHLVTVLLELPSGSLAAFWGRRPATALCFLFYSAAFPGFAETGDRTGIPLLGCWACI